MSDFAGTEYEFAAGSLFGLRGWDMDDKGRLHGVTHREVWTPGENVSICKQSTQVQCPKLNEREKARKASEAGRAQLPTKRKKRQRDLDHLTFTVQVDSDWTPAIACGDPTCVNGRYHNVAPSHGFDPTCSCGFWAYDEAGFARHGTVIGVIEGYGKTTVGTKGFRCEKARIVSLCCESSKGERLSRSVMQRLATLYPEASFHSTFDEMLDAREGVLRTWPAVEDESFWLTPVPEVPDNSWTRYMWNTLGTVPSFTYRMGGVV